MKVEPDRTSLDAGLLLDQGRETIATSPLDATPDLILEMPGDSLAPFTLTVGLSGLFTGMVLRQWWLVAIGAAVIVYAMIDWFWPRRVHAGLEKARG